MLDKITQTSIDSSSKRGHNEGSGVSDGGWEAKHGCDDLHQNLCKNPRDSGSSYDGDNDEEEYLFQLGGKNSQHPQHFYQTHKQLFAVRQLQIESAEDDSNSNNEDNESVDESVAQREEISSGSVYPDSSCPEMSIKAPSSPNISKSNISKTAATRKEKSRASSDHHVSHDVHLDTWYEKNQRLSNPAHQSSSFMTFLGPQKCQGQPCEEGGPAHRCQSIGTPSQTAPASDWSDLAPLQLSTPATPTTTVSNTLCLTQNFVQPEVKIENCVDNTFHFNICYDDTESLPDSPLLFSKPSFYPSDVNEQNPLLSYKGSDSNNSTYSKTSVASLGSSPTAFSFSNEEVKHTPTLSPRLPETSVSTYQPNKQGSNQTINMASYEPLPLQISSSCILSRDKMEPTSSTIKKPGIVHQPSPKVLTEQISPGTQARYKNAKGVIEVERRKRIQKLQGDLVRIQKELEDLNDLEYDVSEV